MHRLAPVVLALIWLVPATAFALELKLPSNAKLMREDTKAAQTTTVAIGPFRDGAVPLVDVDGKTLRQAWTFAGNSTTLQILASLKDQLETQGFDLLFDCADKVCGGFDFRFSLDVFPAPDIHIDLFDYRYVAARKSTDAGPIYVTALISRAAATGFLQLTQIAPKASGHVNVKTDGARVTTPVAAKQPVVGVDLPLDAALDSLGHTILRDLVFETGSSALGQGPFTSLADLAVYLQADETRRVALVGHTDSEGSLDVNIALSKRRAASVLERLVSAYNIPRSQLAAEGMGYLAPIANNRTPEGRIQNRRVEVIVLNTE